MGYDYVRPIAEPLERRRLLAASGDLFPAREYPGAASAAIAVGDVNGDGHPDLVTAGTGNTVLVRFGVGDGTFGPANAWAAGGSVTALAIGDVTGDGKPDVVAGVGLAGTVAVLPNLTGAGTFGPPVLTAAAAASPFAQVVIGVVVGDVTGDGRPDVVAAIGVRNVSATVAVLPGTAAGTLSTPAVVSSVAGLYPESLAVADVNADGRPDLVVGVGSRNSAGSANDAAVLLNAGGGTFGSPVLYPAGTGTAYAAVADVNGDGRPDLVVADGNGASATALGGATGQPILSVLFNAGGGTFAAAVAYGTFSAGHNDAQAVVVADVNGDGHPDAIVTSGLSHVVGTLLNTGAGAFAQPTFTAVGLYPGPLAAADLNGDGHMDVVAVNGLTADLGTAPSQTVTPLLGRADGTFGPATYDPSTATSFYTTVADVTGDGRPDLVVANAPASATLSVSANRGDGTFGAAATYALGSAAIGPAVAADVNLDGHTDLVVPTAAGLSVLLNGGTGTFAAPVAYAVAAESNANGPVPVAVADVTGDGQPDLIAGGNGGLVVFPNLGHGTFAATATTYAPDGDGATALLTADVDGDGRTDVVALLGVAPYVLYGQAGGTLTAGTGYSTPQTESVLALADLNADGRPDLVLGGENYSSNNGVLTTLLNTGNRSFAVANYTTGYPSVAPTAQVADLNGDGHPDVYAGSGGLSFLNAGSGLLRAVPSGASSSASTPTVLIDVTGDGVADVVTAALPSGIYRGVVQVSPGQGDGTFGPTQTYDVGLAPTSLAAADLNGDGKPDLVVNGRLVGNGTGGYTSVLLNQRPATPVPPAVVAGGQLLVSPFATAGSAVTLTTSGATTTVTADGSSTPFSNSAIAGGIRVTGALATGGVTTVTVTAEPAGPLTLVGQGGADSLVVTAGKATLAAGMAGGGINPLALATLTVAAGATLKLAPSAAAADRTLLSVGTLADGGTVDLGNGDAIVTGSTVAAVSALAATGFANGTWAGAGIDSAAAAADARHLAGVGVIGNANGSAALYTTFDGVAVAPSAVLVKNTRYGDTNLDGVVNAADYTRVDAGYVGHLSGWANGDLNYDGVVDGSDYSLMDNAFNQQTTTAAAAVATPATPAAEVAAGVRAAPPAWVPPVPWYDDPRRGRRARAGRTT